MSLRKYIKTYFLSVICIAKNFIWTTLKAIFQLIMANKPIISKVKIRVIFDIPEDLNTLWTCSLFHFILSGKVLFFSRLWTLLSGQ